VKKRTSSSSLKKKGRNEDETVEGEKEGGTPVEENQILERDRTLQLRKKDARLTDCRGRDDDSYRKNF